MKSYYDGYESSREDIFFKFVKVIISILIAAFIIKWALTSDIFFKESLSGPGYSMESPAGWERVPDEQIKKLEDENTTIVAYVSPQKDPLSEAPYAQIAVYTVDLPRNMWMEDEYPAILSAIKRSGLNLVDQGRTKINEKVFHWVLVDNVQDNIVSMQFFYIGENKKFYKIIYSATPDYFNNYRALFEKVKDTFEFKFLMS